MIVVSIIGLLAMIGVVNFSKARERTQEVACDGRIENFENTYFMQLLYRGSMSSSSEAATDLEYAADHMDCTISGTQVVGLCPGGGVVTYTLDTTDFTLESVTCSIHGGEEAYMSDLADFYEQVQEVINSTDGWVQGDQLIEDVIEALGGSLPEVDADLIEDAFGDVELYTGDDDLTWKPSYLKAVDGEVTFVLYAAVEGANSWSNWKGYVVYYDGNLYKSTNTAWDGSIDTGSVAYEDGITDMETFLSSRGFEQF
jgi:hypothetical protein